MNKNFVEFSEGIDDEWKKNSSKYDDIFFKELVAKAIMFKTLDKLVLSKINDKPDRPQKIYQDT